MRCLTVQQPWAWAIVEGRKSVENRTQLWQYRGPLAIHAGAQISARGLHDSRVLGAFAGSRWDSGVRWSTLQSDMQRNLVRGAIIGVVNLVDCHHDVGCCRPWGESALDSYFEREGRYLRKVTHLVLESPQVFDEPIPCRGALGLWRPSLEILDRLAEAPLHELPQGPTSGHLSGANTSPLQRS